MNLPEHIGRYQIQSELGKGAMGVVYKAVDPNIGRTVALKTMRLDVHGIEEAEMLKRFKHEAVLAGVMNHPNIITIYDAGDFEGVFYMAMEFMEGRTLQVVLHEQKVVPIDQVLNIARQVCAGLDFAHQRGVIHRDIKPANIMLGGDGSAKIMDFGIAKSGSSMTTAGQVLGTPSYMSPEQVRGRNLDGRSDLFSFGVCMYEMVTGEKPFTGQNITTIIYKIMNEEPIPPRELDVTIHPGVSAIISKCLAKSVEERYQTGAELYRDLENYKSYGSSAAATKVMSAAAAAESGATATKTGSGKRPAESANDLDSVTTSHIPMEDDDEEYSTEAPQARPANISVGTSSKLRRAAALPAAPAPMERKKLAGMVIALLVVVLGVFGAIRWQRARHAGPSSATLVTASPSASTGTASAQTPVSQNEIATAAKPSAAIPAAAKGEIAPDTVKRQVPVLNPGDARITSAPEGAKITIGGASQPRWITPFTVTKLQPGKYDVTVAKAGYVSQTKEIELAAGKSAILNFDLVLSGGTITVSSTPDGAQILVDGKATGKVTPTTLNVDKGKHKIELRKAGFKEESTSINLSDGEKSVYAPTLAAVTAAAPETHAAATTPASKGGKKGNFFGKIFGGGKKIPAGKGMLTVKTTPEGATLVHNGKSSAQTPAQLPMDPGSYTVTLQHDGYKPAQRTFNIVAGKSTDLNVTLEKK